MKLLQVLGLCGELLTSLGHKAVDRLHRMEIFAYVEDDPDGEGGYNTRIISADELKIRSEIEARKKKWRRR